MTDSFTGFKLHDVGMRGTPEGVAYAVAATEHTFAILASPHRHAINAINKEADELGERIATEQRLIEHHENSDWIKQAPENADIHKIVADAKERLSAMETKSLLLVKSVTKLLKKFDES